MLSTSREDSIEISSERGKHHENLDTSCFIAKIENLRQSTTWRYTFVSTGKFQRDIMKVQRLCQEIRLPLGCEQRPNIPALIAWEPKGYLKGGSYPKGGLIWNCWKLCHAFELNEISGQKIEWNTIIFKRNKGLLVYVLRIDRRPSILRTALK